MRLISNKNGKNLLWYVLMHLTDTKRIIKFFAWHAPKRGRNTDYKRLSTIQNVTFLTDFKLEWPKFWCHYTLTSSDLGDLLSRKYQNYPVLDNRSVYFCMMTTIKKQTGIWRKSHRFQMTLSAEGISYNIAGQVKLIPDAVGFLRHVRRILQVATCKKWPQARIDGNSRRI